MGQMTTKSGIHPGGRALRLGSVMAVVLLLSALPAFSQSCALCYTQAALAGAKMIQALKSGILILVVPPTLGSLGMIWVVHHKRNQVRPGKQAGPDW
jgi:hypothetical protein